MSTTRFPFATLFLLLTIATKALSIKDEAIDDTARTEAVGMVREAIAGVRSWSKTSMNLYGSNKDRDDDSGLNDCLKLYEDSENRLQRLDSPHGSLDALTWLSGALTSHMTCLDSLRETGYIIPSSQAENQNLTMFLSKALASYGSQTRQNNYVQSFATTSDTNSGGFLVSWDASRAKADYVVAQDGSGNYNTINDALKRLAQNGRSNDRVVIYIKSGVYSENIEIKSDMKNLMFVGDGIDKTVVSGNRNVIDGASTFNSATFTVLGDGFWARDITFENSAGPHKHQAVALTSTSDLAVFYKCSFKGYQDTLLVHSQRQFFRDCQIYGTIDFIFGNAAAVFQNCDIFVRRPMDGQRNFVTAQARSDPNQNTGFSIHMCRIAPTSDLQGVKGSFNNFLGRPWKEYSRTVFLKSDLDGMINPQGWMEWNDNFALSTLFYGEYKNSGDGASTDQRVKWPGFHVLNDDKDAEPFTITSFIYGESWISATGVPFSPGL